jgi:hypothetical protein
MLLGSKPLSFGEGVGGEVRQSFDKFSRTSVIKIKIFFLCIHLNGTVK